MNVDKRRRLGSGLSARLNITDALHENLGVALEDAQIRAGAYAEQGDTFGTSRAGKRRSELARRPGLRLT